MRRVFVASALLLIAAAPTQAQSGADAVNRVTAPSSVTPQVAADSRMPAQASLRQQVGRIFTGAVVGGWLGFFASQVAVSDWDKATNTAVSQNRGYWAAGGVVAGALVGRLLRPGVTPPDMVVDADRGRSVLTREAIVAAGAANAHDLIRSMRAEWLVPRGVNSWRETARGSVAGMHDPITVTPGDDHILVYLDNSRVGGTQNLVEIQLSNVVRIEFVDAAAATFRWGSGHAHGVIHIITSPELIGR